MWRHGLVPPSGPRRRGHDPRHAQAAQHGSTWSTGPLGCRRGPKLGSAPAWAKYAGQQQTEGSYQKEGGRLYRQSSASPSKKEAHQARTARYSANEDLCRGVNMTTGGRRLSEYRSAVIGIKARKSRLGGAQQRQSQRQKQKQLASTVTNRFGQEIRVSRTSASGQEIQSQSCQGQP